MAENENAGGYVIIHEWMASGLHLKGTDLVLFAVIYGFTQVKGSFSGSLSYLQKWTNCTKQGVLNCLKSLEQNKLIDKVEHWDNGRRLVDYRSKKFTSQESLPPVKKVDLPGQESLPPMVKKVDLPGQKSLPHNIDYNIYNNIADIECGLVVEKGQQKARQDTPTQGEGCIPPSLEEVAAYCREIQSTVSAQTFHSHYAGNGWAVNGIPLHDWRAKLRYWDAKDREKGKTTLPENRPGYAAEPDPLEGLF